MTDQLLRRICERAGVEIEGAVGSGAFKDTFRARSSAGAVVALKIFRASARSEREQREVDAMRRCEHESIAKLMSIDSVPWEGGEVLFIVEEYMDGGSLRGWLDTAQTLTVDEVVNLTLPLVAALKHLKRLDLVHRDIKPDNIMFKSPARIPALVDLGLVRDLQQSSLTQTWAMTGPGTPWYSSPEQLNNAKSLIESRSDQFSLGVVMHECLYSSHPYARASDSPVQVVERVGNRQMPECGTGAIDEVIARMVAPWPVERFRTLEELESELRAL